MYIKVSPWYPSGGAGGNTYVLARVRYLQGLVRIEDLGRSQYVPQAWQLLPLRLRHPLEQGVDPFDDVWILVRGLP